MFRMEFETDNEAFDNDTAEITSILDKIKLSLQYSNFAGIIRDRSGNTIGKWAYTTEEEKPS